MAINSKLDLRLEAAKLVIQLPETTIDNFHERVHRVCLLLEGDAELPEQDTTLSELKGLVQEAKDALAESAVEKCLSSVYGSVPSSCLGIANPNGIPSSEGEALFLQNDGEKVE